MATVIMLRRQGKQVFATRLDGNIEEFIEDGDEYDELLDGENWSRWKEINWYPLDWMILEEEMGLQQINEEEEVMKKTQERATLIVAWITDEGRFDSLFFIGAYDVEVEQKEKEVIVTYKVYNKEGEEKMIYPTKKFPGLIVEHGAKQLFHRDPREILGH
jgi:hypothetical protein